MLLTYIDDIISVSTNPMDTIEGIKAVFKLKGNKAEEPDSYLGRSIAKVTNSANIVCWTLSSEKYVKLTVANVEEKLAKANLQLPSRCNSPFKSGY